MTHYCKGYRGNGGVQIDCPKSASSWGEFDNGQCDHCHNLENKVVPCDCADCVEL